MLNSASVVDINLDRTEIGSFGFLVLETTDLPHRNKPFVTEFCMIACSPKDLIELEDDIEVPRVSHNLSMCFNPNTSIHPEAVEISGFRNAMLTNQNQFDENAANVIKQFIAHLLKPLCIVAHNGNAFHYPILKRQLRDVGVNLPDDVLCIDSLKVFRKLDELENDSNSRKPFSNSPAKLGKHSSYKLGDIYERRRPKKAKYEYDDQAEIEPLKVVKILKIASSYGELFKEFASEHAKLFSEIKLKSN